MRPNHDRCDGPVAWSKRSNDSIGLLIVVSVEEPVDDAHQERKRHGPDESVEKSVHFESLDHAAEEPEEEAIDDQRKETEGDEVNRERQEHKNRFYGETEKPPEEREEKGCLPAGDAHAREVMSHDPECPAAERPTQEKLHKARELE